MILAGNNNQAVLSNVENLGEFRIRNSAKAFNILSSGLYANKIRAIIRELSCNAVDSHAAAGKANIPFELHLPTTLEPYFSIRDFGTGLDYNQVINIYTTYFESTKTGSNEFIGALGLGSKSPFSYTENFTITAIKDSVKCIFTAFINEQGIPSVALMSTENDTKEPTGVEVQFAVENQHDFYKFRDEAREVYRYFKLRPIVTGDAHFKFHDNEYSERDIVPGVHLMKQNYHRGSVAVMGNIAYPIDVPNASSALGNLARLLDFSLEMHFEIGELDFSASREGLSYIPETVAAIKTKLEALNKQLAIHVANKVKDINNVWEKAQALQALSNEYMFQAAVEEYCTKTKFVLYKTGTSNRYHRSIFDAIKLDTKDLAEKYNIVLRGQHTTTNVVSQLKAEVEYPNGYANPSISVHYINVTDKNYFVVNDTKVGASQRAKYHFMKHKLHYVNVWVIDAADKDKPVKADEFLKDIYNPPKVMQASELEQKPRASANGNAKIGVLRLVREDKYRNTNYVWRAVDNTDELKKTTNYYIPLKGYIAYSSDTNEVNAYDLMNWLQTCGIDAFYGIVLHGVRKSDIDVVKSMKNWVNIGDKIREELSKLSDKDLAKMVGSSLDRNNILFKNNNDIVEKISASSKFATVSAMFKNCNRNHSYNEPNLKMLARVFKSTTDIERKLAAVRNEVKEMHVQYPLLAHISSGAPIDAVAEYINFVDAQKK